jgi:predicted PurR-regulated permease PerM
MPEPSPAPRLPPRSPLLGVLTLLIVVAILAVAEGVLVPIALAVLLAFVLTPAAERLERWGLRRAGAVALVMLLALGAVGGFGYVLARQFADLSTRLDDFSGSVRQKIAAIRGAGPGALGQLQRTVDVVSEALETKPAEPPATQRVRVVPQEPTAIERASGTVGPVLKPLATAVFVIVLVAFMLGQREELRNRIIRLVGRGRVTVTTRTMDEIGQRISRFLVAQLIINMGFGALVAAGLASIGVPYALLWGALTVLLRFVPYVGSTIALVLPSLLAFAVFPGWRETLLTVGLFLVLDVLAAYVVEPLAVGHRTGVSSLALLISALFWTWLWGPVGLLLATPITVCLAVLGKYVPQLEFLGVLLGDEPALETDLSFYQRLVAGDEDEAGEIVDRQLEANPPEQVFDKILVPALSLAERDRYRHEISDADHQAVVAAVRGIVGQLEPIPPAGEAAAGDRPRGHVLGVPAWSSSDELAIEMLARLFDPLACEIQPVPARTLAGELTALVEARPPDLVCVVALPPGGLAHARYACKRLRARFPGLRIVVVRPGAGGGDQAAARLREAGADEVVGTLVEARDRITALLQAALVRPVEPGSEPELAAAGAER